MVYAFYRAEWKFFRYLSDGDFSQNPVNTYFRFGFRFDVSTNQVPSHYPKTLKNPLWKKILMFIFATNQ